MFVPLKDSTTPNLEGAVLLFVSTHWCHGVMVLAMVMVMANGDRDGDGDGDGNGDALTCSYFSQQFLLEMSVNYALM